MVKMENKIFVSEKGLAELKDKLNYLKTIGRPEASARIAEARSFGDLSENSEYDSAKDHQAELEREISELDEKLKITEVIDPKKINTSVVNVGCRVTVFDQDMNEEVTYKIVGDTESDPTNGMISNKSPVGTSLIGKKVGDTAEASCPYGKIKMKIIKIKV